MIGAIVAVSPAVALIAPVAVAVVLGGLWWWDRRSLWARNEQRRLASEAEAERLRLRIAVMKGAEARAAELRTKLDVARAEAAQVPGLTSEMARLQQAAGQVPTLEAALADARAGRPASDDSDDTDDIEPDSGGEALPGSGEEAAVPEAVEHARLEIGRLAGRLEAATERERRAARELAAVSQLAERAEADLAERDRQVAELEDWARAAEADLAERDRRIVELEGRLDGPVVIRGGVVTDDRRALDGDTTPVVANGAMTGPGPNGAAVGVSSGDPAGPDGDGSSPPPPSTTPMPSSTPTPTPNPSPGSSGSRAAEEPGPDPRVPRLPSTVDPEDLKAVPGIGPVVERSLREAGITRLEHLAALGDDEVGELAGAIGVRRERIERDDWVGGARLLLEHVVGDGGPGPGDDTRRDGAGDLRRIDGIGPMLERALKGAGIRTWDDLAALGDDDIDELADRLPGVPARMRRERWVEQAAELLAREAAAPPSAGS